jgi:hypothetical protein
MDGTSAMIAYKFLSAGSIGLFSRYAWPTPTATAPGAWVRVDGEIQPCLNGVHACVEARLLEWLDDELWEIELEDPVLEADGELVARAGRLTRRLDAWNDDQARALVDRCRENAIDLATTALVRGGREQVAEALTAARSGSGLELDLLKLTRSLDEEQAVPLLFLDDVSRLERGGRPEGPGDGPTDGAGGPTPAALAANLSYVCAHVAAQLAERERAGAYAESFAGERLRQTDWLVARLRLER